LLPHIESLRGDACAPLQQALKDKGVCTITVSGKAFELTPNMVEFNVVTEKVSCTLLLGFVSCAFVLCLLC
jgi:hypothetical protein